jgi:Ser/Thr protein kinase RdoA (MazF antagonist)
VEEADSSAVDEEPLSGGNVSSGVVKVGSTVRRPASRSTFAVMAFPRHLERRGFPNAPRHLGLDPTGRQTLTWVPGRLQHDLGPMGVDGLYRVGRIVRSLHEAAATFEPPANAQWVVAIAPDRCDLIVHHDLAPWNLVVCNDDLTFIDWDGAGPGSRLWDLAYAVHGFSVVTPAADPDWVAERIAALVDGYGLDSSDRARLVPMLARRTWSMYELLLDGHRAGWQPWADLYRTGHAKHWESVTRYLRAHEARWASALG